MTALLEVCDLERPGLGPIHLNFDAGECVTLMGRSGSGKALRLRAIADLDPNVGSLQIAGRERGEMPAQILAGVDPGDAVKYQLLIMFLIAGATGLGVMLAVFGGLWRLTDSRDRLRLERLAPATGGG